MWDKTRIVAASVLCYKMVVGGDDEGNGDYAVGTTEW